jgi:phenylpropionate dioxygenase-like ring-hydroxylating dioxygenase large terminal subunit
MTMNFKQFWYIVAESQELTPDKPLARQILGEWLACYRGTEGQAIVVQDRCLHRCARLSKGSVKEGLLTCAYHGWTYGDQGKVVSIPSEPSKPSSTRYPKARSYEVKEQQGYIYVCLEPGLECYPFIMPHYQTKGWKNVRFQTRFRNNVSNCIENFIDVPHTVYVHEGLFRSKGLTKIEAHLSRQNGQVHITYINESDNLGRYSWFLNPSKGEIHHSDHFFMPNVTSVHYQMPSGWAYIITSQSVPITFEETLVYTDLTYHFGCWTALIPWWVKWYGKRVIAQDVAILNQQMEVIKKYGASFIDRPVDLLLTSIREMREAVEQGRNPYQLPNQDKIVSFVL